MLTFVGSSYLLYLFCGDRIGWLNLNITYLCINVLSKCCCFFVLRKFVLIFVMYICDIAKSKAPEERRPSADGDSNSALKSSSSSLKKDKEKKTKKKEKGRGSSVDGPPPESVQLPPGPMVALGRPKDKSGKRARSVLSISGRHGHSGHALWPS